MSVNDKLRILQPCWLIYILLTDHNSFFFFFSLIYGKPDYLYHDSLFHQESRLLLLQIDLLEIEEEKETLRH